MLSQILNKILARKREITLVSFVSYLVLIIVFSLQVALARLLGSENFGKYSAALALVAIIEVPLVIRGSEVAVRALGELRQRGEIGSLQTQITRMVRYDFALHIITYCIITAIIWVAYPILKVDPWLFTILALVIPAQTGFGAYKSLFIVFDKISNMVFYELSYTISLAFLNLIGLILYGIYGLAISMIIAMLVKGYLAYRFTKPFLPTRSNHDSYQSQSLTWDGILSVLRNIFSNGLSQIDIILLGMLQKPEVVALHKVGKSLAMLPIKASFPVWRYMQPKLVKAIQSDNKTEQKKIILVGSIVIILVIAIFFPFLLLTGKSILTFIYGEEYRGSFEYFIILIAGIWAFHGVAGWFKLWVVVTNARLFGVFIYAIAFIVTIAMGLVFAGTSPLAMSYVMTCVLLLVTIIAYSKVFLR